MFSLKKKKGKVYVGLSGGVDSSVSAALLARAGYDVTGVFIRIAIDGYPCPAAQDRIEAMRAAAHLKIPFIEIDLSKEYQARVFDFSISEFAKGRTPNPDALCNREIKFGLFYDFAMKSGADFVATGHYSRTSPQNFSFRVRKFLARNLLRLRAVALQSPSKRSSALLYVSVDDTKDQSYFLWAVPEDHLAHTLFPVGGLKKSEVRKLAKKFGLPNAARPDSQGLCFLGDISIEDMLEREVKLEEGVVLSESGEVIGTHMGAARYTLGQRHGFELSNHTSDVAAHFVVGKDIEKNTIVVSTERYPQSASKTKLVLEETNWIGEASSGNFMARFRYRQKLIPATLTLEGENAVVTLHEPHYVPEGQSLVLYDNNRCMGGGIIKQATLV